VQRPIDAQINWALVSFLALSSTWWAVFAVIYSPSYSLLSPQTSTAPITTPKGACSQKKKVGAFSKTTENPARTTPGQFELEPWRQQRPPAPRRRGLWAMEPHCAPAPQSSARFFLSAKIHENFWNFRFIHRVEISVLSTGPIKFNIGQIFSFFSAPTQKTQIQSRDGPTLIMFYSCFYMWTSDV
jgi:hypothetical protein